MSELLTSPTCLCIVCNHSFDDLSSLADHNKTNAKEKPHKRDYNKTFNTEITCKERKRSHTVVMPFSAQFLNKITFYYAPESKW